MKHSKLIVTALWLAFALSGALRAQTLFAPSGMVGSTANGTSHVGIGTASPLLELSVSGRALFTNGTGDHNIYVGQSQANNRLRLGYNSSTDVATVNAHDGAYRQLWIDGAPLLLNSDSGSNVGIGTTSPGYKLEISGGGTKNIYFDPSGFPKIGTTYGSGASIELYNGATGAMTFTSGAASYPFIFTNGSVGIGTGSPAAKLDVAGSIRASGAVSAQGGNHVLSLPWHNFAHAPDGYLKLVTPIVDNEGNMFTIRITGYRYSGADTFTIQCAGYAYGGNQTGSGLISTRIHTEGTDLPVEIGTEYRNGQWVAVIRIGTPTSSWYFPHLTAEYRGWQSKDAAGFVWVAGETAPAQTGNQNNVVIADDYGPSWFNAGNVGIGTTNPTQKLSVNGTGKFKEVIVETTGWSDYVFADSYELAPLDDVEAHIREHRHLPGIPSAQEVAEQGVSVGDMQAKLLAKIEELTLHLIAEAKKRDEQAARIADLESVVGGLQAQLEDAERAHSHPTEEQK